MERTTLEAHLQAGLSLEQIGRCVDKHPSTIGYWLKKYGLPAANGARYAPRGGIDGTSLKALVDDGRRVREIAGRLAVSYTTVRYWLKRYGLQTVHAERRQRVTNDELPKRTLRHCHRHGETEFVLDQGRSYRCCRCAAEAVQRRRRRVKQILVDEAGGRCQVCGYGSYIGALHFHHRDPTEKSFALAGRGISRSLSRARQEAAKCVLLCSNCHAAVEGGVLALP